MDNNRLKTINEILTVNHLDALLISFVPNIIYLSGFDSFTNIEREGYLLITKDKNYIITDARYKGSADKVKNFIYLEISSQNSLKDVLNKVFDPQKKIIGFESHDLRVVEYEKFKKTFKKLIPVDLTNLRIVKDDGEIEKIKNACEIGDDAFDYILTKIKPGLSEKEIAYELENFIRKKGADISFETIVATGPNSAIPHHHTSDKKLKSGEFVLLDFGVKKDNYCSDMTRVIILGKATYEQKKVYQTVLEANQKSIEFIHKSLILNPDSIGINHKSVTKPIKLSEIDKIARSHIISKGYPSIPHSLGHGVGIEVHESPRLSPKSKDILQNGIVFSIEPGIYKVGWGGIRIEDLVAIQNNKLEILTNSQKELIQL